MARRSETRYWTPSQAQAFLQSIRGDRLYALFHLALGTGLRRGEILGLRWSCVDLASGSVSVRQTLVRTATGCIFKEPKTKGSVRTVTLPKSVVESLRAHRARQAKERLLMGDAYKDHGLVFCAPDGRPLSPDYISSGYFRSLIDKAGLPRISFHGLRHTHATLLGASGVPLKAVSQRLGHSSVVITGDLYSHVFYELDTRSAQVFDDVISVPPSVSSNENDA